MTAPATAEPTPSRLPRWRGFNLQEKFQADRNGRFREEDFEGHRLDRAMLDLILRH